METRATFEKSLECKFSFLHSTNNNNKLINWWFFLGYNSVKLEEGVYFQAPDDITKSDSLYLKFQNVLKEIVNEESELAEKVKSDEKDLEILENHEKVKIQ